MRELQTCDFCGADPVGVYEPLPARLAGEQPRVALCGGCRDTLQRLLAPLDAGADGADGDAPEASTPAASATDAGSAAADPDDASAAAVEPTDEAVTIDESASRTASDASGAPTAETDTDDTTGAVQRPPGYANVLRLVRNRDESLAREQLEAVVSSAYDMSASDVRRAVDAAIENGDLREDGGAIHPA